MQRSDPGFDKLSPSGVTYPSSGRECKPLALSLSKSGLQRAEPCKPGFDKPGPGGGLGTVRERLRRRLQFGISRTSGGERMRHGFLAITVAVVVATAACNGGGEGNGSSAVTNSQQNQTVENVASGAGTPQDHAAVMKARHEHYEAMGKAMKGIGDQLKASAPDMAVIQRHAGTIAGYGPQILGWFPAGSGPEAGRTRAKAEIWSDNAGFRAANERFGQAAGAFNQAAQSGDIAQVRAALPALRQSCANCHEKYRGPEHD